MILYEQALSYWKIAKRCAQHRATNPAIVPTAVRDMQRLQVETGSEAVRKRINNFISRNQPKPPSTNPDGGGPRYA